MFGNLSAASLFNITIHANANTQKHNGTHQQREITPVSLPAWLPVITTPNTPQAPNLVGVSYHSAEIKWNSPTKIAVGAKVQDYLVKYSTMNNLGNKTLIGSNMVQSSNNKTYASLTSLTQGTTYGISVKVIYFSIFYFAIMNSDVFVIVFNIILLHQKTQTNKQTHTPHTPHHR